MTIITMFIMKTSNNNNDNHNFHGNCKVEKRVNTFFPSDGSISLGTIRSIGWFDDDAYICNSTNHFSIHRFECKSVCK